MADYAANPTNAKQDQQIIDLRKRMLAVFLNRCRRMEQVRTDGVWWRFLDPNSSWVCCDFSFEGGFSANVANRMKYCTPTQLHPFPNR
jgi:hypothetical protein